MLDIAYVVPSILTAIIFLLTLVLIVKKTLFRWSIRHIQMPPFVPGLPVVGNSLQLNPTAPYKSFTELAKTYGDIYSLDLWAQDVVIINDYELLRKALRQSNYLSGRPYTFRLSAMNGFGHELVFGDFSPEWKQKKKLIQDCFQKVGNKTPEWQEVAYESMNTMLRDLDKMASGGHGENGIKCTTVLNRNSHRSSQRIEDKLQATNNNEEEWVGPGGEPVNMKVYLEVCAVQTISHVLYGRMLSKGEYEEAFPIIHEGTELMNPAGPGVELDLIRGLWYLYYLIPKSSYWRIAAIWRRQKEWSEGVISLTKELRESGKIPTNLCMYDIMVEEDEKFSNGRNDPSHGRNVYSHNDIIATLATLLTGGVHPVVTLVYAIIGLLTRHQDIQKKAHNELRTVLGRRKATLEDIVKLPYINAIIMETSRYTSTAPMIMRKVISQIEIDGYEIPKDTTILGNLYLIHHDERHWEDPWTFKPDRFLDKDGQLNVTDGKISGYMPFGEGRRLCTGKLMAENQVFLMVAALAQRYSFYPQDAEHIPDIDPRTTTPGLVPQPHPFKVRLEINPWS